MTSNSFLGDLDRYLNIFVSLVMMIVSLVGNTLAILVLSRKSFRDMPMSVYLRFLAVMDTGTVIGGLLPRFILALTDCDVRGTNELSCQFQVFLVYVFTELSAWTLVIVTSERVLSIIRPHKVKLLCTKTKSYSTLIATTIFFLLANLPIFFLFGKSSVAKDSELKFENIYQLGQTINDKMYTEGNSKPTGINCTEFDFRVCVTKGNNRSIVEAWYLTHFLKQSLLPFVTLFVLNIVIIAGLARRHSSVLKHEMSDLETEHALSQIGISGIPRHNQELRCNTRQISRRNISLSVTLVTINAVFLICTFPIGIYQQIVSHLPEPGRDSPAQNIIFTVLVFVLYLNNTLNFFLYCLTGSKFRSELRFLGLSRRSTHNNQSTRASADSCTV